MYLEYGAITLDGTQSVEVVARATTKQRFPFATTIVITAAAVAARSFALFTSSVDADEGVYLVMAQQWLRGGLPYIAVWDQHPPGLPALLTAVQSLIADPVFGARLAATAAVAATAAMIHRFCVRHANLPSAGLLGALLYIVCISRWAGLSANTEIFNNTCVTFAAYQLFGAARSPTRGLGKALVAALALGIGLQIKYVIFPEAVLLCLAYLIALFRQRTPLATLLTTAGLLAVMGCLPTGLAIAYFWAHGALQPFLDANISSNIAYVAIAQPIMAVLRDSASGLMPILGAGLLIGYAMIRCVQWRPRWNPADSPEAWILLWIIAAALDVCLPLKFFRHYFFTLYPPACIGGALALAAVTLHQRRKAYIGAVALLASAAPAWIIGLARAAPWTETDVPRVVAGIMRARGAGDLDVYVYKYQPSVYALARVRPPTPFVLTLELSEFGHSARVDGVKEVRRVMDTKPRFVVQRVEESSGEIDAAMDGIMIERLTDYRLVNELIDRADGSTVRIYER
jgi:hypothetical protein